MKLNTRIYQSLNGEPALKTVYEDGVELEIYYLNDTPYYASQISKGDFSQWSSNGKDFKLLIEKGFYEVSGDLYREDINKVWLNFISRIGAKSRSLLYKFTLPALLIYMVLVFFGLKYLANYSIYIIAFALVSFLAINIIQNRIVRAKIAEYRKEARDEIVSKLTEETVEDLINKQSTYMEDFSKNYYKEVYGEDLYDEEETTEAIETEEITVIDDGEESNE